MWYRYSELNNEQYCKDAISKLFIFDIDETLFETTAKIYVRCTDGSVTELNNQQLNSFDLQSYTQSKKKIDPNISCQYDFDEFKKSKLFAETSKPIPHMISKLLNIQENFINKNKRCGTNSKIILNTARADFDNVNLLKSFFLSYGIDISDVHLHRAGEMPGESSGERKNNLLEQRGYLKDAYGHYEFYDDSIDNLEQFLKLEEKYPGKTFIAHLVLPPGFPKQTRTVRLDEIEAVRAELKAFEDAKNKQNDTTESETDNTVVQNQQA